MGGGTLTDPGGGFQLCCEHSWNQRDTAGRYGRGGDTQLPSPFNIFLILFALRILPRKYGNPGTTPFYACIQTDNRVKNQSKRPSLSLSPSPEPTCSISFIAHPALSFLFYPGGSSIIHGDGGCWVGVLELAIWIFSRGLLKRPLPCFLKNHIFLRFGSHDALFSVRASIIHEHEFRWEKHACIKAKWSVEEPNPFANDTTRLKKKKIMIYEFRHYFFLTGQ